MSPSRNKAEKKERAFDYIYHFASRRAQDGALAHYLPIDRRPHDGLIVAKRQRFRRDVDLFGRRKGDLLILTAPALMKAQHSRNRITFQQAIENGPDYESITKLLRGGESLLTYEREGKQLLNKFSSNAFADAADYVYEGGDRSENILRILDGRR